MKLAMLFPGQGAQAVGMGSDLYRAHSTVREIFQQASDLTGIDIAALCFKGPRGALNFTRNTQPAIYTLSYAIYRLLAERGFASQFVAGHSLGELSAITAAGAISFAQGHHLVGERARLMATAFEDQEPASMAAIEGATEAEIQTWIDTVGGSVWIANLNAPMQIVVSGRSVALHKLIELANRGGTKVVPLQVSGAFHTPLLRAAGEEFSNLIGELQIKAPLCPVIGNISGTPLTTADEIRSELTAQMCSPVQWSRSMNYLCSQSPSLFVEVGPGKVLKGLLLRNSRNAVCFTSETTRDLDVLLRMLEAA